MAEGFGRYYPAEFARYLRLANGELAETVESLDDGVDASRLASYLDNADPPNGLPPSPRRRRARR